MLCRYCPSQSVLGLIMARPSAIDDLNPDDKEWLSKRFMDQGFCGYEEIAKILSDRGYNISKSSIHRYGQKLESKLEAVQTSTKMAMAIAEAAPDDGDQRSAAVLSMMQTGIFNALMDIEEADGTTDAAKRLEMYAKAGKGIAEITKASVNQKKWQIEVREKVDAALKAVDKIVKKGGLSKETAEEIRKQILGIAG